MALVIHYTASPGVDQIISNVRLGSIAGVATAANQGTVAGGTVDFPDFAAALSIKGLKRCYIAEDSAPAGSQMLWDGYIGLRTIDRGDYVVGRSRHWNVTLHDLNNLLSTFVIQGPKTAAAGVRPAETDVARIAWLLASSFMSQVNDYGLNSTAAPFTMEAVDYRGQTALSVLRDCSLASGKQFFTYYDETHTGDTNRCALFYDVAESTAFTSTLRFSNVPGDADDITTFNVLPSPSPSVEIDPSRVVAGLFEPFAGPSSPTYRTLPATATNFYWRDGVAPSANVKSLAAANARADRMLTSVSTESEVIRFHAKLPRVKAGLVHAGHRISFRLEHLPGYEAFRWGRILQLTFAQDQPDKTFYHMAFEVDPLKTASSFLIAFPTVSNTTQQTDVSTNPWTTKAWCSDIGSFSVIGCGAGPPLGQSGGVLARLIVAGENATVGSFKLTGLPTPTGGTHVYQIGGIDLAAVMAGLVAGNSKASVADGGTASITVNAGATNSLLIGMIVGAKVSYDGGWLAASGSNWGGVNLVTKVLGEELVNLSSFNDGGESIPWVWIGSVEGTGNLTVSAKFDSHGGGSGAYACGYNVGLVSLLIPLVGVSSITNHGFGGSILAGGSYDVVLVTPPIA